MAGLGSSIELNGITVRNRIVMPPMVLFKANGSDWEPDENHIAYYADRAAGGVGLVVVEATAVDSNGRLSRSQLRMWDDSHIGPMSAIAKAIKAQGAAALVQIHHAGASTSVDALEGATGVTPSGIAADRPGAAAVRPLEAAEVPGIVDMYAKAAARCMAAGFDGVEIHGAHGYLLSQFLSPAFNKRTDEWGGGIEGRLAMPLAVVKAVREAVGPKAIVNYRLGAAEALEGGLTLEDGIKAAQALEATGCINALNVSSGMGGGNWPALPEGFGFSHLMYLGYSVKKAVTLPVIGVGGIKTGAQAQDVLDQGIVDMVAIGKGLLADPRWAERALAGRDDEIATCLTCPRCGYYSPDGVCPRSRKRSQA